MVGQGQVAPDHVTYNDLPWKYAAGTPNILGTIVSAQALRLILDWVLPEGVAWFGTSRPLPFPVVHAAMQRVGDHTRALRQRALDGLLAIDGLTLHGPTDAAERSPLVAFTVTGTDPMDLATRLDALGVESRAGCHCATLAHRDLGLTPPASCRLSFALYTSAEDVDRAVDAVRTVVRTDVR
jgi:cysteine desulfurase/selenocysteine lyase